MSALFAKYNQYLTSNPLTTKMLTSGAIGAFGDLLCQTFELSKNIIEMPKLQHSNKFYIG